MKSAILIIAVAATAALAASCTKDDDRTDEELRQAREVFLSQTEIGVYHAGAQTIGIDKATHQIYINEAENTFTLQNDAGEMCLEINMENAPGEGLTAGLTMDNSLGETNYAFDDAVDLKEADGKHWLWSDKSRSGVIIYWPE